MILLNRHGSAGVFNVKQTQSWRLVFGVVPSIRVFILLLESVKKKTNCVDSSQSGVGVASCGGTQVAADERMKGRLRGWKRLLASVCGVKRRLSALKVFLRDSDFFLGLLFLLLLFLRFRTFKGLFLKNKLTPKGLRRPRRPPLCVATVITVVMITKLTSPSRSDELGRKSANSARS